jgi:hypothetical protein
LLFFYAFVFHTGSNNGAKILARTSTRHDICVSSTGTFAEWVLNYTSSDMENDMHRTNIAFENLKLIYIPPLLCRHGK